MGLRTVLQSRCPKENAYSTPIPTIARGCLHRHHPTPCAFMGLGSCVDIMSGDGKSSVLSSETQNQNLVLSARQINDITSDCRTGH
ncbi:hypothetical protein TNCV_3743261 [Trichonephila clavipes]|nr:hypothetical protein TNCV_3743261 [Trichonephila clavipes]